MTKKNTLTTAQRLALEAVRQGLAYRIYRSDGNVLVGPKGVGAAALRALEKLGLITDGPDRHGAFEIKKRLVERISKKRGN